jgi:diguanylate cyclase
MRLRRHFYHPVVFPVIILFVLLLISTSAPAFDNLFILEKGQDQLELNLGISYLEDPEGSFTIGEVREIVKQGMFRPSQQKVLNFTYTDSTYWFYTRLQNSESSATQRYLEIAYPLLDYLDIYLDYSNSKPVMYQTGDKRPFDSRPIEHNRFIIPLELKPHEFVNVLIRLETDSLTQLPLKLWTHKALLEKTHKEQIVQGSYFGLMLTLLVINLLIYLYIRDNNYLRYVFLIFTIILFQATISGYFFQFLWGDSIWWNEKALSVFVAIGMASLLLFIGKFLKTASNTKKSTNVYRYGSIGFLVLAMVSLIMPYFYMIQLITYLTLVFAIFIFFHSLSLWKIKSYTPKFIFLSWMAQLSGIVIFLLHMRNIIPINFFSDYSIQIGSVVLVMGFSVALIEHIKRLNDENNLMQLKSQYDLEQQVVIRTAELKAALHNVSRLNQILEEQNNIDELTGVKNRRFFNRHMKQVVSDSSKEKVPLSLIIIDIDYFKQVNDKYGHLVGDRVLESVSSVLKKCGRRTSDHLIRYGGEEFAMILYDSDLDNANHLAEKMRQTVENEKFLANEDLNIKLTVSIGVASVHYCLEEKMDQLIIAADAALYKAKKLGRNRVVVNDSLFHESETN